MEIEKITLSDFQPAEYNPRVDLQPGDDEYQKIEKSINEFGFLQPLIVNKKTGHIISGFQRAKILREKGITKIEAVVVNFSLTKEKQANLAFNKVCGAWDQQKLARLLDELSNLPDFDVGITGFDTPEISQILDRYGEQKDADDFDFEASLKSIDKPITKKGNIIALGDHFLMCGDSADAGDLRLLMQDNKADMLFCDPPFGVSYYQGNRPSVKARPKKCRQWRRIYKDDLSEEEYEKWMKEVFFNMDPYISSGGAIYVWNAHKQFACMHRILSELHYHISCVITWAKPSFSISYGDYNQQTEFCLYGWKENNGAHRWYGATNASTLWEAKRDATRKYEHLTQKPVELPARAISNSSQRGDIILELFGGSGSTLVACEGLKRRCFCMEIDAAYCDSIIRRYIGFVGKDKVSAELKKKYIAEEVQL